MDLWEPNNNWHVRCSHVKCCRGLGHCHLGREPRDRPNGSIAGQQQRHRMKITTIVISLACLSQVTAKADELATPTPTPATYLSRPGRLAAVRRQERRSAADSRTEERKKQKVDRTATATADAQARQAARAREKAQREVAAQNLREARNEKPHLTSDLMSRMGFSEQQIAEQKAREQSANADSKKKPDPTSPGQ